TEIWRWAHSFPKDDRKRYMSELEDMSTFMKEHYPAAGSSAWPRTVRMTSFFTRSTSGASFALCYCLNGIAESLKDRRGG
ncbi:MAG: hypothetical protein K5911_01475, partial [Eubacteriales bacterium]|nr:hypothetical protein [Eubacteriales bacterium]